VVTPRVACVSASGVLRRRAPDCEEVWLLASAANSLVKSTKLRSICKMNVGAVAAGRVSSKLVAFAFAFALLGSVASCGGRVLIDDWPSGGGSTSAPVAGGGLAAPVGGAPLAGAPGVSVPDASVPDASVPDASVPDASAPDASVPDASVDASVPDASAPDASVPLRTTPKRMSCGDRVCDMDAHCCLSRPNESDQSPTLTSCSRSFCSMRRECDESADCVSGEICCYSVVSSPPSVLGSYCGLRAKCGVDAESWIACGKPQDCSNVDAPACVAQKCAGTIVQACGQIPRAACRQTGD
jgi:hypothetical protein